MVNVDSLHVGLCIGRLSRSVPLKNGDKYDTEKYDTFLGDDVYSGQRAGMALANTGRTEIWRHAVPLHRGETE